MNEVMKDQLDAIDVAQITQICQRSEKYHDERTKHLTNHERWFKKRFGVRPSTVNWPWPGAANLHLPLIDKTIRRSKPNFYNACSPFGVRPTVTFDSRATSDDLELVRGIERSFDEMIHNDMEIFRPLSFGIDKMLEKGYFTVKVIQEFTPEIVYENVKIKERFSKEVQDFIYSPDTTDQQLIEEIALQFEMDLDNKSDLDQIEIAIKQIREGKDEIEFQREVNTTPHPSLFVKDAVNVIVPPDTCDIRDSRQIEDRIPMTFEDILFRGSSGKWNKENTYELLQNLGYNIDEPETSKSGINPDKEFVEQLEEQREGVSGMTEDLPVISEFYFFHKWPGDKLPSRTVVTCHRDHPTLPLKVRKYNYQAVTGLPAKWPFGQVTFEVVGERYHSPRGYAQMLDSLQTEIVNNHNAKQNWMTIANSLNMKVKKTAQVQTGWIPGQPFYVNRMDDVEEMNFSQRDLSFDNEERGLKGWAEEYIGLLDSTLVSPQSGVSGGDARTKAEIDAVQSITVSVAGADMQIFQMGMAVVYQMIWERWMQFGPQKIKYTNGLGEEVEVDKEEIKRRFKMTPTANIGNVSKQVRLAKSQNRYALFKGNPMVDQGELIKDYLINDDDRLVQRLYVPPANVQQSEVERQAFEIGLINMGYTVVPKPEEDDDTHIKVIDNFLQDPVKRAGLRQDRIEALVDHRSAHMLAMEKKSQATSRGGRMMEEVAQTAMGETGREARK